MNTLIALITTRLTRDEEGATAVEYGIMVALIAAAIVATVALLGTQLDGTFQGVIDVLPGGGSEGATE